MSFDPIALLDQSGLSKKERCRVLWEQKLRHETTMIADEDGGAWVVKRCGPSLISGRITLDGEARFHRLVAAGRLPAELTQYVPSLRGEFEDGELLVFEGYPSHVTPTTLIMGIGYLDTESLPYQLGRALAALHSVRPADLAERGRLENVGNPIRDYTRCTPEDLAHAPGSFRELLKLLQLDEAVAEHLASLRASWSPTRLIHGDMKLENVLVPVELDAQSGPKIVDWELAGIGDPRWDCAGVIGSYVGSSIEGWLFNDPSTHPDQLRARTRAAIRTFWSAYAEGRAADPEFEPEREGGEAFSWAGYWLLQRVVFSLPLARALSALELATISVAGQLLLDSAADA